MSPLETMKEATEVHTRLLRTHLALEESRAFWAHTDGPVEATVVFEQAWFGAKSLHRVKVLLADLRARYLRYPAALRVLHGWRGMGPDTRRLLCHWHLQLADPLYRRFSGRFLVALRDEGDVLHRRQVVDWLAAHWSRWGLATRTQFASKLLSAAHAAGLLRSRRDPRSLALPPVPDEALGYLMQLLRGLDFAGSLTANPYLASVGLEGAALASRLRALPGLAFRQQGGLVDIDWGDADLEAWAQRRREEVAGGTR